MTYFKSIAVSAGILLFICCSPKMNKQAEKPAAKAEQAAEQPKEQTKTATTELANADASLYSTRCGKCHQVFEPAKYSAEEWDRILPVMSRKARLTPEEHDIIAKFITSKRQGSEVKKG